MNSKKVVRLVLFLTLAVWSFGAAGMKTRGFGMTMSLTMSDRDFSFTIDAVTGKLLAKE